MQPGAARDCEVGKPGQHDREEEPLAGLAHPLGRRRDPRVLLLVESVELDGPLVDLVRVQPALVHEGDDRRHRDVRRVRVLDVNAEEAVGDPTRQQVRSPGRLALQSLCHDLHVRKAPIEPCPDLLEGGRAAYQERPRLLACLGQRIDDLSRGGLGGDSVRKVGVFLWRDPEVQVHHGDAGQLLYKHLEGQAPQLVGGHFRKHLDELFLRHERDDDGHVVHEDLIHDGAGLLSPNPPKEGVGLAS